ncbi:hypothetical protein PHISCL_07541 [Aspergillus sclerotialis]|uniref:Uncharacterized protein n=1 Tax=Aspergillus sclerotialis TaxID=2070753 RepID=A0A3A2ZSZ3_9EURO|nr:hypothetical protein PHISCL_07541 [Aspergillus sclerotialis]
MSNKRKLPASSNSPSAKRPCPSYADDDDVDMSTASTSERPRCHPIYGQRNAFPGLDEAEDELFYGPAEDGMEYLRMVRSEANSLPFLFTAPKSASATEPAIEEAGDKDEDYKEDDQMGIYEDGAYIAPPVTGVGGAAAIQLNEIDDEDLYPEVQMSYYNLLRHRFLLLRSTLKCAPPLDVISALDESHPISFPRHSVAAKKEWRRLLLSVDPQMAQLACMDMDSVLGVLGIMARLMSENFRSGDAERVRRIGAWAWGLLGKCREVGQLSTEEVGEIRELGKRAVKILHKMKEDEKNNLAKQAEESSADEDENQQEQGAQEEDNNADSGGAAGVEIPEQRVQAEGAQADATVDELEAAKARLQERLQDEDQEPIAETNTPTIMQETGEPAAEAEVDIEKGTVDLTKQIHAMLDMIIMVVGEFYGQRDLLGAREVWRI